MLEEKLERQRLLFEEEMRHMEKKMDKKTKSTNDVTL